MSTDPRKAEAAGFWETRTGWGWLKKKLLLEPLPGGARWAAAFGSLLLFSIVLQVVTGILLAMNYAPTVASAYPSVKFIQEEVPFGWLIRALHHWGSSLMVILLLVHMIQVFVWGAYKRPRELTWMVGVVLLFCTMALAFTGYLLPWDQKAYWASKVGLDIVGTVPLIGPGLQDLLQGGSSLGNLTLTRFFSLHGFVLPGLLIVLVVVHLYLFRLHGVTPPWWETPEQLEAEAEPFWPGQVWKDAVLALAMLIGLGVWCWFRPAPLEASADPSSPYEARPEWYFMFLFRFLRYFEGRYEVVGTFVIPTVFFMLLFFWPLLDRNPARDPRRRPVAMALLALGCAGLVGLTIFAVATDVRMVRPASVIAKATPEEKAGPVQKMDIAALFNSNCSACHGVDGTGEQVRKGMPTIPDLTSLAWQLAHTDLEITHQILEGKEPLMPAYRDKLSKQQTIGLAIYVRAFAVHPSAVAVAETKAEPPASKAAQPESPAPAATPAAKGETAAAPKVLAKDSHMSQLQIYRAYCLACHDADGRGGTVRKAMPAIADFTDTKWQDSRTDADLRHSILEGKGQLMLPMKDKVSAAEAEQLVAYIRGFKSGKEVVALEPQELPLPPSPTVPVVVATPAPAPAPVPAPGAAPTIAAAPPPSSAARADEAARLRVATGLFRQYCVSCHGVDGQGAAIRAGMPTIPYFSDRTWQQSQTDAQLQVGILEGKGTFMPAFRGRLNDDQARDLVAYVRAFGPPLPKDARAPATDFEKRYDQLQLQWDELERQLQKLGPPR